MSNKYNNLFTLFQDIANVLKTKLGLSKISPTNFASQISNLSLNLQLQNLLNQNGSSFIYTNNTLSNMNIGLYLFNNGNPNLYLTFAACERISLSPFESNSTLKSINCPICSQISGYNVFRGCSALTDINFPLCEFIGSNAFESCISLTSIDFPSCITIESLAFARCYGLTSINFPNCTRINHRAFWYCSALTSITLPKCTSIGYDIFGSCINLTTVSLPVCNCISNFAFNSCYNLISLYLLNSTVCKLKNDDVFKSTPIGGYSNVAGRYGSIFVPASLIDSYKTSTTWSLFANRIFAYEDYFS